MWNFPELLLKTAEGRLCLVSCKSVHSAVFVGEKKGFYSVPFFCGCVSACLGTLVGAGRGGGGRSSACLPCGSPLVHEELQKEGHTETRLLSVTGRSAALRQRGRKHRASRGAGAMSRIQTFFVFLALCSGTSESWFWQSWQEETTTVSPTEALETNGSTTPAGPTSAAVTATNAVKVEEDDNLSGIGEEIVDVDSGIRKFFEVWNATARTTQEVTEKVDLNSTGNANTSRGEGEHKGSGSGPTADVGSSGELAMIIPSTSVVPRPSDNMKAPDGASHLPCLPVPSDWPICSVNHPQSLVLPNFLNHTSVDEVGAVLKEWAWLARKGCHPSAEWFLCLLLVPRCPAQALLPCRSFCQTLRDSCWPSLDDGRLPVECHLLPDVAPNHSHPTCLSVSNLKGNLGGLERIPSGHTFLTRCLSIISVCCCAE